MKRKSLLIVFAVLCVSTVLLAAAPFRPSCIDLEGAWVFSQGPTSILPPGPNGLISYHPIKNRNHEWIVEVDAVLGTPTLFHENAVSFTASKGIAVQTGKNLFSGSTIGYILDVNNEVLLTTVVNVDLRFITCDQFQALGTVALFVPEQDVNNDGIPDEGMDPVGCVPIDWIMNRIPIMPKCVPTPGP